MLEDLLKRIKEEAQKSAAEIIEQGKREAAEIEKKWKEKAKVEAEASYTSGEKRLLKKIEQEIVAEQLLARRLLLAEKKKYLELIFEEALKCLRENGELQARFFRNCLNLLETGSYQILVAEDLKTLLTLDWVDSIKKELEKSNRKIEFIGYRKEIVGGVVLVAGKKEIFLSPERMLSLRRPEIEILLGNLLFS